MTDLHVTSVDFTDIEEIKITPYKDDANKLLNCGAELLSISTPNDDEAYKTNVRFIFGWPRGAWERGNKGFWDNFRGI